MAEDQKVKEPQKEEPKNEQGTPVEKPEQELPHEPSGSQVAPASSVQIVTGKNHNKFVLFLKTKKGKVVAALAALVVMLGIVLGVPVSRYAIFGIFIKRDVMVTVIDKMTTKPVSEVTIESRGASAVTNADGMATLSVPVGFQNITANKKYYVAATRQVEVPLWGKSEVSIMLEATGRQVPLKVMNKITGKPLADAKVTATDENLIVTTDAEGKATMVVPADKTTLAVTVTCDGFNESKAELTVTEQEDAKNDFSLTPTGKVYFLSKRSGKIDVMKSDLDGTNAKVVIAGTGLEEDTGTTLLASRNWQHLALLSRRVGDKPKLYLIDTTKGDELSVIDEGNASFQLIGWYDNRLAYVVNRENVEFWQPKRTAVKSFDATARKITVIQENEADSTSSSDYAAEWFSNYYLIKDGLVFTKEWSASSSPRLAGKKMGVVLTGLNGDNKKTVKEFDETYDNYIQATLYAPQEIYFRYKAKSSEKSQFFELDEGTFKDASDTSDAVFDKTYPTFLISPSGERSLWSESRDGKVIVYVGDKNAGSPIQALTSDEDIAQYGWYGEDYLLVSKKRSELYVIPREGATQLSKITDYHRPNFTYEGYGYGYGGY